MDKTLFRLKGTEAASGQFKLCTTKGGEGGGSYCQGEQVITIHDG